MPDFSNNFIGVSPRLRARNFALPATEALLNAFNTSTVRWGSIFDAAYTLDISSSSANDKPASQGAKTVDVYGLDKDFNFLKETIALDGTTVVTTVNAFRRVFEIVVATAGTSLANVGDIYVIKHGTSAVYTTPGIPDTLTSAAIKALAGDNFGLSGIWTAPRGTVYTLSAVGISARGQSGTIKIIRGFPNDNGLVYPSYKIDYAPGMPVVAALNFVVKEKEDVYFTGLGAVAGGFVSVVAQFVQQGKGI
jgi:hypothetical protein